MVKSFHDTGVKWKYPMCGLLFYCLGHFFWLFDFMMYLFGGPHDLLFLSLPRNISQCHPETGSDVLHDFILLNYLQLPFFTLPYQ